MATEIEMPEGATIIHVAFDPSIGGMALWALTDPSAKAETRHFSVLQTGEPTIDSIEDCLHVGTSMIAIKRDGELKTVVNHVWEIPRHVYLQAKQLKEKSQ
jgi:hypothetical protein